MNIVTSADSNFFHCLEGLAETVRKHYGKQVICYDVGLTEEQRNSVDAHVIPIEIDVDFQSYATYKKNSTDISQIIKATHKPFCVNHYFNHFDEPMILVDADCTFTERLEETGFDLGVTLRRKNRIDLTNPWIGILNTGVIFFNKHVKELIDVWEHGCIDDNTSDQKALSEILSETIDWKHYDKIYDWNGIKVKVFNAAVYNDVRLKDGKIFHFKGKRHDPEIYQQLLQAQRDGGNLYELFNKLTGRKKKTFLERLFSQKTKKSLSSLLKHSE